MKTIRTYIIIVLTMLFIKPADVMAQSSTPGFAPDGVVLNKNVVPGSQPNTYTINLEAFVTGSTITTTEVIKEPIDFALVLDLSASMNDYHPVTPYTLAGTREFTASELVGGVSWSDYKNSFPSGSNKSYTISSISYSSYPTKYAYLKDGDYYTVWIGYGNSNYLIFYVKESTGYTLCSSPNSTWKDVKTKSETLYNTTAIEKKIDALKNAAKQFVEIIASDAKESKMDHTISILRFNSNKYVNGSASYSEYTGTEAEGAAVIKQFKQLKNTSNEINTTNVNALKTAIDGLKTAGQTHPEFAMKILYDLIANQKISGTAIKNNGHKKAVIFFTDGEPGSGSFDATTANTTVGDIKTLKNAYGATVYSIGIFDHVTDKGLQYMNATSSNYPNATKYTDAKVDEKADTDSHGYFKLVGNESMTDIFAYVANDIISGGANYGLTKESTTVIDVVAPAFKLPDGASGSTITLQVAKCKAVKSTGTDGSYEYTFYDPVAATTLFSDIVAKVGNLDDEKQFVEAAGGKTVQVLGFDFSENYVGEDIDDGVTTYRGYKLIISFPIEIDPRNPGGANVATNTEDSGIYFDEDGDGKYDQIGGFEIPHAKIPNLVIKKTGLHKGESATFYVYKLEEDGSKSQFPIVLVATQTSDDPSAPCYARAKIQEPGRYEVEESTWSWAYKISQRVKDYAVDDADKSSTPPATWNELGYGDKGLGYQAEIPWKYGTEVPEGTRSIIRNVNDFTEDPTQKGTLFTFTNEDKPDLPAHGEASKNNLFYENR